MQPTEMNQSTSVHQRTMRRISPNNPVRRRLTFGENDEEPGKIDNFSNILQESIAKDRKEKSKTWNFDFENEVPLNGLYQWYKKDGDVWIGMAPRKSDSIKVSDEETFSGMQYNNENTPVHTRVDPVPNIRERRNVKDRVVRQSVKRKLNVDCSAVYRRRIDL